jgi:hypothetical protein
MTLIQKIPPLPQIVDCIITIMKLVTLKPSTTCFTDNNMGTIVQFWMVYMNELIAKIGCKLK